MSSIELRGVSFAYGSELIIKEIDLVIDSGDFLCLLGPSGCGKSTVLRLISGLAKPQQGEIVVDGMRIYEAGIDRGIVFQDYSLFPWMSTGENIMLALRQAYPEKSKKDLKEISIKFLKMVGLESAYNKLPGNLSGGMRQRAAIARAFAINPPILLMDEPFGALDAVTRARLQDLVVNLWSGEEENKKTVVFVTHDVEEALLISNKIVVLGSNGKRIQEICSVDFQRPRLREQLYDDPQFISLRNHLVHLLNEDVLNKLAFSNEEG